MTPDWNGFLQIAFTQLWQVTALAICVGIIVHFFARQRPHLAHVLWLVVLIKSLTPPLWCSSLGIFSWISPDTSRVFETDDRYVESRIGPLAPNPSVSSKHPSQREISSSAVSHEASTITNTSAVSIDELRSTAMPVESRTSAGRQLEHGPGWRTWTAVWSIRIWITGTAVALIVAAIGWTRYWRQVICSRLENPPGYEAFIASLAERLKIRRPVRLMITSSSFGPAVVGFIQPTIILPQLLVNRKTLAELEPILAHELIHVRRSDLCWGVLQIVSQSLWWFHPLLWIVNRRASAEAERCCDEEVIGTLRYDPARYANCLLQVLELKLALQPVPILPGLRAVEVTLKRLERIMKLRQGCRQRTPWWCWVTMIVAAAATLPGAAFVVEGADEAVKQESVTIQKADATPSIESKGTEFEVPADAKKTDDGPVIFAVTYYVGDLIQAHLNSVNTDIAQEKLNTIAKMKSLAEQIKKDVAPTTWTDQWSTGAAIEQFPSNRSIVVAQSSDTHKQIAKYLNEMRMKNGVPLVSSPAKGSGTQETHSQEFMYLTLDDAIAIGLGNSRALRDAKVRLTAIYDERRQLRTFHLTNENELADVGAAMQSTAEVLSDIHALYWDLWLAKRILDTQRDSRDLVQKHWKSVYELVQGGIEDIAAEQTARENYFFYRKGIEDALKDFTDREKKLRFALGLAREDGSTLYPVEKDPNLDLVDSADTFAALAKGAEERLPEIVEQRKVVSELEQKATALKKGDARTYVSRERQAEARNAALRAAREKARLDEMVLNTNHLLSSALRNRDANLRVARTHALRRQTAHNEIVLAQELHAANKVSQDLVLDATQRSTQASIDYFTSLADFAKAKHDVDFRAGLSLEKSRIFLSQP